MASGAGCAPKAEASMPQVLVSGFMTGYTACWSNITCRTVARHGRAGNPNITCRTVSRHCRAGDLECDRPSDHEGQHPAGQLAATAIATRCVCDALDTGSYDYEPLHAARVWMSY